MVDSHSAWLRRWKGQGKELRQVAGRHQRRRGKADKDCSNQPNGKWDKGNPMAIRWVRAVAVDWQEVKRRGSCGLWVICPCGEEENYSP